jgi:hypothetical protein
MRRWAVVAFSARGDVRDHAQGPSDPDQELVVARAGCEIAASVWPTSSAVTPLPLARAI